MLLLLPAAALAGGTGDIGIPELEGAGFTQTQAQLIDRFMPADIKQGLADWIDVIVWRNYISALRFDPGGVSDSGRYMAIYYSSGVGNSALQLYATEKGEWVLKDETRNVSIGGTLGIAAVDVDCDGKVELAVYCVVSAAGYESVDLVKIVDNRLVTITPHEHGKWIRGRRLTLKNVDDDCELEIEGYQDGNEKYDASIRLLYKLDRNAETYTLRAREDTKKHDQVE